MTRDNDQHRFTLGEMIGAAPYGNDEIARLRRRAWIEQDLLIVSANEASLNATEYGLIRRLGERLYERGE